MADFILSLNAGSSSLKFALTRVEAGGEPITVASGKVEGIGTAPHLIVRDAAGHPVAEQRWETGQARRHEAFFEDIFDWVDDFLGTDRLIGVGHRVVHGGVLFAEPVLVTGAVLATLDALCPLAPLHQPHNLAAIRAVQAVRPGLPQIACFDTGFHHGQPPVATRFAIPRALAAAGVRRYGFHGLNGDLARKRKFNGMMLSSIDFSPSTSPRIAIGSGRSRPRTIPSSATTSPATGARRWTTR